MTIAAWGFAPALAAGNAVVLKPAELTPLTAMRLGELALEAGLPEGLFEVVTGSGSVVGQRFVSHPDVRKVVFTGSTEVGHGCRGRLRARAQAGHARTRRQERERDLRGRRPRAGRRVGARQRCSTTPGRTAARAAASSCSARCSTASSSCSNRPSRTGGSAIRTIEATEMGPLISAAHRDTVTPFVEALARRVPRVGAGRSRVLVRARRRAAGLAARPRRAARDLRSDRRGAAVRRRGRRDPSRERHDLRPRRIDLDREPRSRDARLAGVKSGVLSVNSHSSVRYTTPFGGMKASGLGRELGPDAAEHFTETKNVFFATDAPDGDAAPAAAGFMSRRLFPEGRPATHFGTVDDLRSMTGRGNCRWI